MKVKKIRVALFCISPMIGGIESVVFNMLKSANDERIEYFLITNQELEPYFIGGDNNYKNRSLILKNVFRKRKGIIINKIRSVLNNRLHLDYWLLKRRTKKVLQYLIKNEIKIIHSNVLYDYIIAGEVKKALPSIKLFLTMHGTLALDPEDTYQTWLGYNKSIEYLNKADVIFSACQFFVDILIMNQISKPFRIIPNGIDIALSDRILNSKNTYNHNDSTILVFLGGNRIHQKGGDILIKALYILKNYYNIVNFKLWILRDVSPENEEYKIATRLNLLQHIEFKGFIPTPLHLEVISQADIFVLPSRHEGVANTLMEAIGLNKKIIATNVGGTPEYIDQTWHSRLSEPNANNLALCIKEMIEYKNNTSEGINYPREKYDWKLINKSYADAYLHELNK